MVLDRSWHLPGNPNVEWHPARLIKEGRYVDLPMITMHRKDTLPLLDLKALLLPSSLFILSPRISMLCHCSLAVKERFLIILHGTKWSFCADVPVKPLSFILSFHHLNGFGISIFVTCLYLIVVTSQLDRCRKPMYPAKTTVLPKVTGI